VPIFKSISWIDGTQSSVLVSGNFHQGFDGLSNTALISPSGWSAAFPHLAKSEFYHQRRSCFRSEPPAPTLPELCNGDCACLNRNPDAPNQYCCKFSGGVVYCITRSGGTLVSIVASWWSKGGDQQQTLLSGAFVISDGISNFTNVALLTGKSIFAPRSMLPKDTSQYVPVRRVSPYVPSAGFLVAENFGKGQFEIFLFPVTSSSLPVQYHPTDGNAYLALIDYVVLEEDGTLWASGILDKDHQQGPQGDIRVWSTIVSVADAGKVIQGEWLPSPFTTLRRDPKVKYESRGQIPIFTLSTNDFTDATMPPVNLQCNGNEFDMKQ
jgi:hypothetical protein